MVGLKKTMTARLAYAYVALLLALEMLLLIASCLLHLSVWAGAKGFYAEYGSTLFRGAVIVGIPATVFIKDGLRWIDQLRSCPSWMWKTALALGAYGILILCLQVAFPQGPSIDDQSLAVSGFPLGFDAISFCVLYSVLRLGYLDKLEVVRRALVSLVFVALGVAAFVAYRAGYLHHPGGY